MDDLYSHRCGVCGGFHNELEQEVNFSKEVLARMLREIYDGLNVRDEIQRDAFMETLRLFNEATVKGLEESGYVAGDRLFYEQLRTNNEVFSAFRTHRMQNDLAARMMDDGGKLKPFDKWVRDVEDITDHYVMRWLRTEYDTAVLRAHQAADWKRFEADSDVLPNLRWMPTTSPDPDIYHRQYWEAKLTLPVGHPFWKSHRPGDRWNCKCSLEATDEPATAGAVADFKPVPQQPGLDNNPADDGKLFSDSHPYIANAHPGAEKAVMRLTAEKSIRTIIKRLEDGYSKGDAVMIGRLDNKVKKFVREKGIELFTDDVYMTDKQIHHALRTVKQQAGKAVSPEQLAAFPSLMEDCEVYWDEREGNIQFITRQDGKMQKFVVSLNYLTKIQGKKKMVNAFITAGRIEESAVGMHKKIR